MNITRSTYFVNVTNDVTFKQQKCLILKLFLILKIHHHTKRMNGWCRHGTRMRMTSSDHQVTHASSLYNYPVFHALSYYTPNVTPLSLRIVQCLVKSQQQMPSLEKQFTMKSHAYFESCPVIRCHQNALIDCD